MTGTFEGEKFFVDTPEGLRVTQAHSYPNPSPNPRPRPRPNPNPSPNPSLNPNPNQLHVCLLHTGRHLGRLEQVRPGGLHPG